MTATMTEAVKGTIGQSVPRIEDRALVTGNGRFIDDIHPDGCTAAAFVRSPYAHAAFARIETAAALAMPGVHAIFTLSDLAPLLTSTRLSVGLPSAAIELQVDRPVLADAEVVHVGEAIAMVIADTRAQAEDAAEAVEIETQRG